MISQTYIKNMDEDKEREWSSTDANTKNFLAVGYN